MTEAKHQTTHASDQSTSIKPEKAHTSPGRKSWFIASLFSGVIIILAIFFGLMLIIQPGEIIFQETATELNRDFVNTNLNDIHLEGDVYIGSASLTEKSNNPGYVLYDILLPVTDFYSTTTDISLADAENSTLTSIWDLDASKRVLSLDGKYYLDTLDSGAFFEYLTVEGKNDRDVQKVIDILQSHIATFPTSDTLLTFAQTGVTALSRRMNTKLSQVSDATYFSEKIGSFLRDFDITHTSNESSFSQLATGSNICSDPDMINVLTDIGLDVVELTGNHNQDCGDADAIATIEKYHSLGISTFGGGINSTEAAKPLEINEKSNRITLLGYNYSTGGYTLDNTPGANFYTKEKASQDISDAKARGDIVIVDIQYFECNGYADTEENTTCDYANSSEGNQVKFFRDLIDMGADIVVGTAAHQPQTFEQYNGGEIYYGLGNLFFDQSAWPGTTRSLVLVHYFWQDKLLQTRIIPTVYDNNFQTELMSSADAVEFLERLIKVRPTQ